MIETVKCVAVLKANIEHGRDYLDTFLPFIASLAKEKSYKSVDIPKIQSDFKEKYGIKIPYHALRSILSRGMRSKLIKKSSDNYIFIESKIDKFAFTEHVKQKEKEIEYIYDDFCKFCLDVYNIKISEEKVTDIIISYLKKYDAELLILSESILPETSVSQKEEYVFYKYITELYNNREHDFRIIVELAVGYLFASTIFFSNIENRRISLKNSSIFLDTRLLLRLIGLEGKEKQGYYETLLVMLKKNKAKIKVFEHTIDEANHILDESIRLIGRDKSSLQYIGPSLKFFIEEKYSASDIMLIKAKLEKTLNEYGIKTYDGTIELKELDEFINEKRLEELILEEYNIQQDTFLQWKKRNVILRDVKSISRIRQYRKGHFFSSLRNCNAVFITTNSALARSSRNYILEEKGRFYIPECVTDVFVGTHVWLDNPPIIEELQEKKIITDTISFLEPNHELVNRYIHELKKLKDDNAITEAEFYFMKTQAAIDKLEDKVFGNPDVFDDELPQEMLEEFKRDVSKPLEDEFHNIVDGKNKEISELVSINEKKEKAIENSRKVINKVHLRSSLISKIITYIFAIIVAVIFIACIILTHTSISNKIIKYTIQGVLAVLTILNIGFGFTLRLFFGKLKDGIEKRIVKFLT